MVSIRFLIRPPLLGDPNAINPAILHPDMADQGLAEAPAPRPPNDADLSPDLPFATIFFLAIVMGLAVWNALEVIFITYLTYCRLRTLYFWSIMASASGVIGCVTSQIINLWVTTVSNLVSTALGCAGWIPMVTGQSLVLYSRLHLLYIDHRKLRLVLAIIIFNAVILHVTTVVLAVGANTSHPGPFPYLYSIMEKAQVTVFCFQEALLSGMYLWYARTFLKKHAHRLQYSEGKDVRAVKRTLRYLVVTNIIILLLDVSVLVLQYLGLYIFQLSTKNFVYSVKLKLEIGVLNQLKDFVKRTRSFNSTMQEREEQRLRQLRQEEHIEVQWEAALRRAFGTISRSLRTRVTGSDERSQEVQRLGATPMSGKIRSSRPSVPVSTPEFFNREMLIATSNERVLSPTIHEVDVDKGHSTAST